MIQVLDAERDLGSQQKQLSSMEYDLRITNLADFICSKVTPQARSLMDIGAGNGLFLKFFKRKGFHVSGIELEKELVSQMKKDPELKQESIQQGDITQMHGDSQFDVVVASDVVEHIKDDEKALTNLMSYVKKGGQLVITVPAHPYLYGKRDEAWGHYRRYSKQMLEDRLKKLGGTIQFIGFWNSIGYLVYYFYEKILHSQINEEMRYSSSPVSRFVRTLLESILKWEKRAGGVPIGLTLVAVVQK